MRTKIKTLNRFAFAGNGTVSGDMALDLIEAMELIKEMRLMLVIAKAYNCDCECESCSSTLGDINTILDRTKEYAE